ncbi:MAG: hypothetical protein CM1200mP28_02920 [Deltaproteobacteria bacterium]|nr:MAG: hypothetical protein CM1200mP28_02920 [Deltaproteobacteria bacterium]
MVFTKHFPLEQNIRDQKMVRFMKAPMEYRHLIWLDGNLPQKRTVNQSSGKRIIWFDNRSLEGELKGWVAEWKNYRALMFESIDL